MIARPTVSRHFPFLYTSRDTLAGPYDLAPTSDLLPDEINEHRMDEFKPSKQHYHPLHLQ